MRYCRVQIPGGTYSFAVVTYRRRKFICEPDIVELLRTAFRTVKSAHPFTIDVFAATGTSALYLDVATRLPTRKMGRADSRNPSK